ncbi:MAG TPA: hypothetical protein VLH79_09325 [Chthonomonadales bacterium]|nr:hypothetical protein [Chthonomonadales bacterium]
MPKHDVPENPYRGELVSYPGPWAFLLDRAHIILVSDQQLEAISSDPDAVVDLSLTHEKRETSLRRICEEAQAAGQRTLVIAFDHFWGQYRPGQATPRRLMPDMPEYIERMATVGRFAQAHGLGLELSLLSPLEIGTAYERHTGESGIWMHYRKGVRNPESGAYSVHLWQQLEWVNNKGPIRLEDAGVRVFAFREQGVTGTAFRAVDPAAIVEITDTAGVEVITGPTGRPPMQQVRVFGSGRTSLGPLDRVLAVQLYRTPEMDYFSERALPFLTGLVDQYADAGVRLNGLYSDEMHIQQDWSYGNLHDNGEFAVRYVSPGLVRRFADLYGAEYGDLAPYMVYFCYGQEDSVSRGLDGKLGVMHTFGESEEDIQRTALFRSRYYRLLQDGVVELFAAARRHAEERMGHRLEARAHATWAESPTIDFWRSGSEPMYQRAYEYTSDFVWSNTVHQAASACHDYFRWGDFLTGNGTDHPECGWLDRDYWGLALACSIGVLNEVPYAYCAHWGMPAEVNERRTMLSSTYGAGGSPLWGIVQGMQPRDVSVLMLYPLDLVSVEERFGSWMTQYGYWNMVTQAKLLEMGALEGGAIVLGGRRFTTLVASFEPFPSRRLLNLMQRFVDGGGRLIWSGPPPVLTAEGEPAGAAWRSLFGVRRTLAPAQGLLAPGRVVTFEGPLRGVPAQTILTDLLPDRIYPVEPADGVTVAARTKGGVVGTVRALAGGGTATFLGFRPRDDQSASLGYETRTWFEALSALGAYAGSGPGRFASDNTERLSRTTRHLVCRFPNGAVAIAPHLTSVEEGWPGGFVRDARQDAEHMRTRPLPSDEITLRAFRVNGHAVDFSGRSGVCFRVDDRKRLIAFAGAHCRAIRIDRKEWVFADEEIGGQFGFAPVPEERRVPGGAVMIARAPTGGGTIRLPAAHLPGILQMVAEGARPGSRGEPLESRREGDALIVEVTATAAARWLYAIPAA